LKSSPSLNFWYSCIAYLWFLIFYFYSYYPFSMCHLNSILEVVRNMYNKVTTVMILRIRKNFLLNFTMTLHEKTEYCNDFNSFKWMDKFVAICDSQSYVSTWLGQVPYLFKQVLIEVLLWCILQMWSKFTISRHFLP